MTKIQKIQALRNKAGKKPNGHSYVYITECKKVLEEANEDFDLAYEMLRKNGKTWDAEGSEGGGPAEMSKVGKKTSDFAQEAGRMATEALNQPQYDDYYEPQQQGGSGFGILSGLFGSSGDGGSSSRSDSGSRRRNDGSGRQNLFGSPGCYRTTHAIGGCNISCNLSSYCTQRGRFKVGD